MNKYLGFAIFKMIIANKSITTQCVLFNLKLPESSPLLQNSIPGRQSQG